jgi:hypothetical protein
MKIFFTVIILLFAGLAYAQQDYNIIATWDQDGQAAGFNLYQDGTQVCYFDGDVRQGQCTITMTEFRHSFTLTNIDGWGGNLPTRTLSS